MSVCVLGALNVDWVARVAALPRPGETVLARNLSRHPGGKGLNQAVAAARAGAAVRMIGRVGRDGGGDWLVGLLEGFGVDAAGVGRDAAAPTGQAQITVAEDGENCIVVAGGANAHLPRAAAEVRGAQVLLAQLETALEPVAALFAAAPPGCLKVLNAAPALAEGAHLFAACDVLVVNEQELAAYASPPAPSRELADTARRARSLLAREGQAVVVTLGARGALLVRESGVERLPARPAQVVDTVGAGDCFCGVLAAGLDLGLDLHAAAVRANIAAALAVSRRGVADVMPTREEIDTAERGSGEQLRS